MRRLLLVVVALAAALAVPGSASAHAVLVSSEPAPFAVLDAPPDGIVLRFNEPVGTVFASVRVLAADGNVDRGESLRVVRLELAEVVSMTAEHADMIFAVSCVFGLLSLLLSGRRR